MASLFPTKLRKRHRAGRHRITSEWGAAFPVPIARASASQAGCNTPKEAASCNHTHTIAKNLEYKPSVFRKPLGATLTKSGRWLAFYWHPITRVNTYLGSYNTPQEAGDAYTKKKLEMETMYPGAKKLHRGRVHPRESSRWYAVYQDPITKCASYLGGYGSAEAAEEALSRKMCGFQSIEMQTVQSNGVAFHTLKEAAAAAVANNHTSTEKNLECFPSVFRKPLGATLTKSGKWDVHAWDPAAKVQLHLGLYSTPQEAGDAYTKKRLEIETMYPGARKLCRRRESSKWYAVIQDPITRCATYLGTYDTAEEAADAYSRKKHEFDSMEMQTVQSNVVAEEDTDYNVGLDLGSSTGNAIKQEIALAFKSEAGSSMIRVANGDSCKDSGMDVENSEIPTLRSVIKQEFGMGVIDAYGQLIGEFNRMDDELWFV